MLPICQNTAPARDTVRDSVPPAGGPLFPFLKSPDRDTPENYSNDWLENPPFFQ